MQINVSTVALVTGGASGLGEATTRRLHAGGAAVVIVDLPSSPGKTLAGELGDRVRFCAADVRDETQVQAAIAAAHELGDLRIVVNCAGVGTPGRIVGRSGPMDLESFRNVIDVNLIGTFNVVRLAAAAMLENTPLDGDRGIIVMTASIAAYDGQIGQAAYSASKGGIVALTLSAARWPACRTRCPLPWRLRCLTRHVWVSPASMPRWSLTSSTTACSTARSSGSTVLYGCLHAEVRMG